MTRSQRAIALFGALALLLVFPPVVLAEDAETGRRQFKRGQELLKVGDYRAAARAFEAGYAAAPRVGFLLNIGNCYRKLGELGKARAYYWRFLDAAPKDHPSRPAVMDYLRAMEQIEADGVSVDGAPTTRPPPGGQTEIPAGAADDSGTLAMSGLPSTLNARPEPVQPLRVTEARMADADTLDRPVWKRWWFWVVVGGAVAAGATAVLLTRPSSSSCGATLGCANEN